MWTEFGIQQSLVHLFCQYSWALFWMLINIPWVIVTCESVETIYMPHLPSITYLTSWSISRRWRYNSTHLSYTGHAVVYYVIHETHCHRNIIYPGTDVLQLVTIKLNRLCLSSFSHSVFNILICFVKKGYLPIWVKCKTVCSDIYYWYNKLWFPLWLMLEWVLRSV